MIALNPFVLLYLALLALGVLVTFELPGSGWISGLSLATRRTAWISAATALVVYSVARNIV